MSAAVAALVADADKGIIAAHRYLAFLEQERLLLLQELYPDGAVDGRYFVPLDDRVTALASSSPLDRAASVLDALDIDPHADDDGWVECVRHGGLAAIGRLASKTQRRRRAP